jgi:hypothetical protein
LANWPEQIRLGKCVLVTDTFQFRKQPSTWAHSDPEVVVLRDVLKIGSSARFSSSSAHKRITICEGNVFDCGSGNVPLEAIFEHCASLNTFLEIWHITIKERPKRSGLSRSRFMV